MSGLSIERARVFAPDGRPHDDAVVVLRIARPAARNALDAATLEQIAAIGEALPPTVRVEDGVQGGVVDAELEEHGDHRLRARRAGVHEVLFHRVHVSVDLILGGFMVVKLRQVVLLSAQCDGAGGTAGELGLDLRAIIDDGAGHGVLIVDAEDRAEVGGWAGDVDGRLEWEGSGRGDGAPARRPHRAVGGVVIPRVIVPGTGTRPRGVDAGGGRAGVGGRGLGIPVGDGHADDVGLVEPDLELVAAGGVGVGRQRDLAIQLDQLNLDPTKPLAVGGLGDLPGDRPEHRLPGRVGRDRAMCEIGGGMVRRDGFVEGLGGRIPRPVQEEPRLHRLGRRADHTGLPTRDPANLALDGTFMGATRERMVPMPGATAGCRPGLRSDEVGKAGYPTRTTQILKSFR